MVYRSEDLSLLNTVTLDESPAIVIPHYDADSNTLFLSGKGESTVCTRKSVFPAYETLFEHGFSYVI